MKELSVLVTGGAGFIGSNLCDFLIKQDHKVIVIDNLSTGKIENLSKSIDEIDFIKSDLENYDLSGISKVDAVIHLAAQASVPLSISDFKNSSSTNILGTISVIDFCSKRDLPLIYASSSAVYGELPLGNDCSEEVDLLSPYSIDKYIMEIYAKNAFDIHELSSVGLRFFNVYGPRQDPSSPYSGVISIFVDKLLNDQSIKVNGGHQTRDFIYIDDVIKCIYSSLKISLEKAVNKRINVLTGIEISINDLVLKLSDILQVEPKILYEKLNEGDPERSGGSINKMQETLLLQSQEFVNLHDGLQETIKFIKEEKL